MGSSLSHASLVLTLGLLDPLLEGLGLVKLRGGQTVTLGVRGAVRVAHAIGNGALVGRGGSVQLGVVLARVGVGTLHLLPIGRTGHAGTLRERSSKEIGEIAVALSVKRQRMRAKKSCQYSVPCVVLTLYRKHFTGMPLEATLPPDATDGSTLPSRCFAIRMNVPSLRKVYLLIRAVECGESMCELAERREQVESRCW